MTGYIEYIEYLDITRYMKYMEYLEYGGQHIFNLQVVLNLGIYLVNISVF